MGSPYEVSELQHHFGALLGGAVPVGRLHRQHGPRPVVQPALQVSPRRDIAVAILLSPQWLYADHDAAQCGPRLSINEPDAVSRAVMVIELPCGGIEGAHAVAHQEQSPGPP